MYRRGEVYYANLPFLGGHEQSGIRPVVVLQNNKGNAYSPTLLVSPVTSRKKKYLPTHVRIADNWGLSRDSMVLLEQIMTLDKSRMRDFICALDERTMERIDKALKVSLGIKGDEKKVNEIMHVELFENKDMGISARAMLNDDGSISINAEDTAIGFGWTQEKNGKLYVKWERINGYLKEFGFSPEVGKDDYIPESLFYRLGMKASNARADRFQNWLAMEVIPSIRKTGGYQQKKLSPEEMMRVQLGMIDEDRKQIKDHESRIENLENNTTLDYGQQRVLEETVNKTVIGILGGKESSAYKNISRKVFAECNHDLKHYFNVNARNNVPKKKFDEAIEYAKNWKPCTNTEISINEHNAQMTF